MYVSQQGSRPEPSTIVNKTKLARIESDEIDNEYIYLIGTVNGFSRSSKTGTMFSEYIGRGFRFEYNTDIKLPREDHFSWSQYTGQPIRVMGRFVRFFDGTIKKFSVSTVDRETK